MGYSSTAAAAFAMDWIRDHVSIPVDGSSNAIPGGGFWEVGRENPDGAITGTVWKPWAKDPSRVVRRGSFRVDPDGSVVRFPGLTKAQREAAGAFAVKRYAEAYGGRP